MPQTKILVVDDSALMRKLLTNLLEADPELRVIDTARDGQEALEKALALRPDVITLDIEMPGMSGLTMLTELMARFPIPTVVVSGREDPDLVMESLQLGALDFVVKPSGTISVDLYKIQDELIAKVKLARRVSVRDVLKQIEPLPGERRAVSPGTKPLRLRNQRVVVIGASTGGPQALDYLLSHLPARLGAPILVIQHMPAGFTNSFARRLSQRCQLIVKEAEDGDLVKDDHVYIAPGGYHMIIAQSDSEVRIRLDSLPPTGLRPSANVLIRTVVQVYGPNVIGVILTGMGSDGAEGLELIKQHGGTTIAQDETTSVVYGMPRAAIERGVVDQVLPLWEIPAALERLLRLPSVPWPSSDSSAQRQEVNNAKHGHV